MVYSTSIRTWTKDARKKGKARDGFRKLGAAFQQWERMKTVLNLLILNQRIELSKIWANELQQYAEEVVFLAKKNTPYHDGIVESMLKSPEARQILYEKLVPRYELRNPPVTRVINLFRYRERDTIPLSMIEYIDRPGEAFPSEPVFGMNLLKRVAERFEESRRERRMVRSEAIKLGLVSIGDSTQLKRKFLVP